ncbi:Uncharacterised protein [uncultured archaeon]|nr:Uncharacterised protein [uncultured archaeon]
MRISIWIGFLTFGIGILLSYLAKAMIQTQTAGAMQTTAATIASIIFVLFSATMLGTGAGLVIHWIFGFAKHWKAFVAEIVFSVVILIIGIGASLMSGNIWTGMQEFVAFLTASIALFVLSFITMFGGIFEGFKSVKEYIEKRGKNGKPAKVRAKVRRV